MKQGQLTMNMPELRVFARALVVGFAGAELWRLAFYLGAAFAPRTSALDLRLRVGVILVVVLLCVIYAAMRGLHAATLKIARSYRLDLLFATVFGIWANHLATGGLTNFHEIVQKADPNWAPAILVLLCAVISSPLLQQALTKRKRSESQLYFISDKEVDSEREDLFSIQAQAKSFAQAVLESSAHAGLVFGIDGPWGVGKTSFINLAARYWEEASDRVIVCRFEPLRYASEPDLAERMIRDVSSAIQRKVFAPEFRPVASRYARLIKGKADFSFLGFKLTMEPSEETADDLLEDIDQALTRIGRRVVIVIDDLDRLDAKSVNAVLFATRRTFNLSQATYILCYDTEILTSNGEESSRARHFLEKFVTVNLSLFVDSSRVRDFLRRDWQREENHLGSVPSDTMLKLGAVLAEAANILDDGELAAQYLPLLGDMRKVKRFVNAMRIMQLEKSDLGRTDFNKRDLINLILLHLNYPALFRRIYAEETEGRIGTFSVRSDERAFKNSGDFTELIAKSEGAPKLLLAQLFDVDTLALSRYADDEAVLSSRACFNQGSFRNLEKYLKLIVRFATPEPRETYVLYQRAVQQVINGTPITSVLGAPDFKLEHGELAHEQFWNVLVNQSGNFTRSVADDAIDTLVDYLPRYSFPETRNRGLRQKSIYSLLRLLDRAGWGRTSGRRLPNRPENVAEIAWRIFGEGPYKGKSLLERLSAESRGVVGWYDLMLFRLQCSADRQSQLHNLQSALIVDQTKDGPTAGLTSQLALEGMRKISQEIAKAFVRRFVDARRNFYAEVDLTPDSALLGEVATWPEFSSGDVPGRPTSIEQGLSSARNLIKVFVAYQLSNSVPPNGSGVGCGYYDESGDGDRGGIAKLMNKYLFDVCFNPNLEEDNIFHFLNHCLSHLSSTFFMRDRDDGYVATKEGLPGGLDSQAMGQYWAEHRDLIRKRVVHSDDRQVITSNYVASYDQDLAGVFEVLDELARDSMQA